MESFDELLEMNGILLTDVNLLVNDEKASHHPSKRRSVVRAVAASIEATTYLLKRSAADRPRATLDTSEILMIKEETPYLQDNGVAKLKKAKLSTLPHIKFTFKLFCKVYDMPLSPSHLSLMQKLPRLFEIRDRLTHPKSASSLNITDEELEFVLSTHTLFVISYADTIAGALRRAKEERNELLREKDELFRKLQRPS